MRILLCNDDGINAPGIIALAEALADIGEVFVAAPDSERSAASNSLTLSHPIRANEVSFPVAVKKAFAISGTPSDCAKLALTTLMGEKPDIVISGVNRGSNMCVDIFYSGTVASAFEGAFKNILSIAISLDSYSSKADFLVAAKWGKFCAERLLHANVRKDRVYNVNVPCLPDDQIKGLKVTRSGIVDYNEHFDSRIDPNGRPYYWIQGNPVIVDSDSECDVVAVKNGFVSITPLQPDLTDKQLMQSLAFAFSE